jgi:hypothetical protein
MSERFWQRWVIGRLELRAVIDASNKRAIEKLELEQMSHLRKECVAEVD